MSQILFLKKHSCVSSKKLSTYINLEQPKRNMNKYCTSEREYHEILLTTTKWIVTQKNVVSSSYKKKTMTMTMTMIKSLLSHLVLTFSIHL